MTPGVKSLDICLSPELLHLYDVTGKTVVVTDILRATSCMVTAFGNGVKTIKPYADLDSCRDAAAAGYETSGERNGIKVEGFHRGNSPFEYMGSDIRGKQLAFTTTNGTQAIEKSRQAAALLIGAFLNIGAVADACRASGMPVLIVCAGWKGRFNLEDTLFAGALAEQLSDDFNAEDDSVLAAVQLWQSAKSDVSSFLQRSSHVRRLNRLNIHEDFDYCLKTDLYQVVPRLEGDHLVA